MQKYLAAVLAVALVVPVATAVAEEPSHPLSHIDPIDENFNMSDKYIYNLSMLKLNDGTVSGTALVLDNYTLRDEGNNYLFRLDTGTGQWRITGSDLNLTGNNIQNPSKIENFFSASCAEHQVIEGVNSDGSYNCVNITAEMEDKYVNESGDSMTGALDMGGFDIDNPGQVDGVTLDAPGAGIVVNGDSVYEVENDSIGDNKLNNSDRLTIDGINLTSYLNASGNRIRYVPAPEDPWDAVNKSYVDWNDDTIDDNQTLQDVLAQGNDAGAWNIDMETQDINMIRRLQFADRNNDATHYNITESGGDLQIQKDGNQRLNIRKGGGISVRNGDLFMSGNKIQNTLEVKGEASSGQLTLGTNGGGGSGYIQFYDNAYGNQMLRAYEGGPYKFINSISGNDILRMNASGGSSVEIPNGNLKLGANSIMSVNNIRGSNTNFDLQTEGGGSSNIRITDTANSGQVILNANEGGNVQIPNGNLNVNNQLTVGSTECGSDEFIDGSGGCTNPGDAVSNTYVNESGDTMEGNLDFDGYNITNLDTLKFEEGTSIDGDLDINGSIDTTGDLNMSDQDINDVRSINGDGDSVRYDDDLDMNENEIVNVNTLQDGDGTATVRFDGSNNIEVPNGELNVSGGDVLVQDGSSSDPSLAFHSDEDTGFYRSGEDQVRVSIGGSDTAYFTSELGMQGNINVGNNAIYYGSQSADSGAIRLDNGASIQARNDADNGDIELIGTDSNDNIQIGSNGNVNNLEIENSDLVMRSNNIDNVSKIKFKDRDNSNYEHSIVENPTTGDLDMRWAGSVNLAVAQSGKVELQRGNLDLQGNKVVDTTSSDSVTAGDGSDDSVTVDAGGSGSFTVNTGDTSGGSTERFTISSASGDAVMDVRNADLDLNGNNANNVASIDNGGSDISVDDNTELNSNEVQGAGKVGVGTSSPSENLDVDGTASVSNSGTTMEVDSGGDVVVTLGS